ncbi:T9SS type A sorting domain-containing protein [candidate division KSB1 bacterium]|nr:T9SS type A sorting domain-containing protein [candidate division KSB1 bacterium]
MNTLALKRLCFSVVFLTIIFAFLNSVILFADTWTNVATQIAPPARSLHMMAAIEKNKVLLFGGYDGAMAVYADTWLYNGKKDTWTNLTPANSPSERVRAGMAYIGDGKVLMYGGNPLIKFPMFATNVSIETWLFDLAANTWTKLTPANNPPGLANPSMCYIGDDKVLLFGGAFPRQNMRSNQTWIYDLSDNTWTKSTASGPSARASASLAFLGGDKAILFGGYDGVTQLDDTWRFDYSKNKWVLRKPSVKPPARYNHTSGYVANGKIVIFGGRADIISDPNSNSEVMIYGDTWIFDNASTTWTQDMSSPSPDPRGSARMAELNLNNAKPIVLFGGASDVATFGDTWTYSASLSKDTAPLVENVSVPEHFVLEQNYPNPFNPKTTIRFQLPKESHVKIAVYDMLGHLIETLVNQSMTAGSFSVVWNAGNHPSGIYLYRLEAGDFVQTHRMILLK